MLEWLKRAESEPDPDWQPIELYHASGRQLQSSGGAYVVLPYGLLAELSRNDQASLVDLLKKLARENSAWTHDITYEVRAWRRVRVSDLSDEDLTWHGITTDVGDTGDLTYTRGGRELAEDVVVGHRPVIDPTATLPGTYPGGRPQVMPTTPQEAAPGLGPGSDRRFRRGRAERLMLIRQRREAIVGHVDEAHALDGGWVWSIASTDELWGPDEQWKLLLGEHVTVPLTSDPSSVPADDQAQNEPPPADAPETRTVTSRDDPTGSMPERTEEPGLTDSSSSKRAAGSDADVDAAFLARLEADLQDLY